MKLIKRFVPGVCAIMMLAAGLGAQTITSEAALAEIDTACRDVVTEMVRVLPTLRIGNEPPRFVISSFDFDGQATDLGSLWALNMRSFIAESGTRNFSVLADTNMAAAQYSIRGEILLVGSILRIQTKVVRISDSTVAWSRNRDLKMNDILSGMIIPASGSSVRRDSLEPDSRSAPVQLAIGADSLQRTIHANDEDWFSVRVDRRALLTVETTGDMDTFMHLFIDTQAEHAASNDDGASGSNARIMYVADPGRVYLFKVTGYSDSTGAYGITARTEPFEDFGEPNNNRDEATLIQLGQEITALFGSASDVDWYSMVVPSSGGLLQVFTGGDQDTVMELYDARGNLITEDDDSGSGGNARIRFNAQGGIYFVRVADYDNAMGRYTLTARLLSRENMDRYEPDDTMETAKPIEVNAAPQEKTFSDPDDEDWARFTISTSGRFIIESKALSNRSLDTYIELYDEDGELWDEDDDGGSNYDARLTVNLEPGTWYIRVRQVDDEISGDGRYSLSVTSRR